MRVFLAGTANNEKMIKENMPIYVLESFYYIKEWQKYLIDNCDMFLLDSGAFTFMNNNKGEINWKEYIDKYADFIIRNDVKYFFELDIDAIVGYEKVKEYTKYLESKVGRKSIPVWHKSRGIEEWERLTKEYDYIAIGGFVIKEITKKDYKYIPKLLDIAKKNRCKVHGLGFTSMENLKKLKFYSVDSTTWQEGSRFGVVHLFDGEKIKKVHSKEKRAIKTINEHNYPQWLKYQKYADKFL